MTTERPDRGALRTAAARRLMDEYRDWLAVGGWEGEGWDPEASAANLSRDLIAIEAEAARLPDAAELERLRRIEAAGKAVVLTARKMTPEIAALNGAIALHPEPVFIGIDPGAPDGDWTAWRCPNCGTVGFIHSEPAGSAQG